jgi:uncharacterized membrane protein YhdT
MDRFLASAHHKWPYGVLYPAVPQRKATEQALEMVGLTVAFIVVGVNSSAFASGALMGVLGPIRNPLGIEGFTQVYEALLYTMAPLLSVAAALSVFTRLRRATGVERQQVKWFVYAAAANISGIILAYVIPGVIDMPVWFEQVGFALNIITLPAIPAAKGIACTALQALRDRPDHQPHPRLRRSDGAASTDLLRGRNSTSRRTP